jgi:hypothetical protein
MSVQSKITRSRDVSQFYAQRVSDYGELLRIELAETKTRLLHEVIGLLALAVGALFTLSFLCIALIASGAGDNIFSWSGVGRRRSVAGRNDRRVPSPMHSTTWAAIPDLATGGSTRP